MESVDRLNEKLIHLGPGHWEVILDEDSDDESQLVVATLRQDHVLWMVDHPQQLCLNLSS